MVNLKWDGKIERTEVFSKGEKTLNFRILDNYPNFDSGFSGLYPNDWKNLLFCGENKALMNFLLENYENKISMIYIDPPFATGGEFKLKIQIGELGKKIEDLAYVDKWKDGLHSYFNFIYERLIIMKKLLNNKGSIYVHLDWHISHYIKLLMDEIFGYENFRNEIIWAYPAASVKTRRFFIRSYDTILFYSKSDNYTFNDNPQIYMDYSNRVKKALKRDDKGIFYYRGGSHNGKKLSRKVYVEQEGIFPRDVWNDIPYIRANTSEYQGFSTQKPERLLKRIILASTNENDLIADFFCGSGTTLAVADKLGRRWIGCDLNKQVIHMTRKRLLNISKSNNILDWSKLYDRKPHPFQIIQLGNVDKSEMIDSKFLIENVENNRITDKINHPKFEVIIHQNDHELQVQIIDYKLPFMHLISENVREKIDSFTDWIDYWGIDYYYDGQVFNNMWTSFRTPKKREIALKSIPFLYEKKGRFNLSVKSIDIFGIETIKSFDVEII